MAINDFSKLNELAKEFVAESKKSICFKKHYKADLVANARGWFKEKADDVSDSDLLESIFSGGVFALGGVAPELDPVPPFEWEDSIESDSDYDDFCENFNNFDENFSKKGFTKKQNELFNEIKSLISEIGE